jgi:hypothetical protein
MEKVFGYRSRDTCENGLPLIVSPSAAGSGIFFTGEHGISVDEHGISVDELGVTAGDYAALGAE